MRKLNELMLPEPMVSLGSPRKIRSYMEKYKLYSLDRMVGATKCGK